MSFLALPKSVNTPRNGLKLSGRDRSDVSSLMMGGNKNLTFQPRQQKAIQESWTFLLKEEHQPSKGLYVFKLTKKFDWICITNCKIMISWVKLQFLKLSNYYVSGKISLFNNLAGVTVLVATANIFAIETNFAKKCNC